MSDVYFVVPHGLDDPRRPSGGNAYDQRLARDLARTGWRVHPRPVAVGSSAQTSSCVAQTLAAVPRDSTVLVDGLVGSAADSAIVPHAQRLRLVALVHLPLGAERDGLWSGDHVPGEREQQTRLAEASVLHVCRAVIATSEWTVGWLADHYGLSGTGIWLARPGADPAPAVSGSASGSRLLCVGAVTPVKGQDLLVAALAHLHDLQDLQDLQDLHDLDWCCSIVGPVDRDPDFVARLREQVRQGGLGERVRLLGPMGRGQLQATYAASDLLVLTSRVESYGMVVTEALAHGLPVVATDVGGIPEAFAGPGSLVPGTLVPAGDSPSLATALRRWLTEPRTRDAWREAAAQRRPTVSDWTTTVEQVAEVLVRVSA
ncbi:MAG TPA: glycosyltransferase family 4 protein [Pedococcus sp.]|nr:glycosyltransferase family 4 protein [Pedococcus sp.]